MEGRRVAEMTDHENRGGGFYVVPKSRGLEYVILIALGKEKVLNMFYCHFLRLAYILTVAKKIL